MLPSLDEAPPPASLSDLEDVKERKWRPCFTCLLWDSELLPVTATAGSHFAAVPFFLPLTLCLPRPSRETHVRRCGHGVWGTPARGLGGHPEGAITPSPFTSERRCCSSRLCSVMAARGSLLQPPRGDTWECSPSALINYCSFIRATSNNCLGAAAILRQRQALLCV